MLSFLIPVRLCMLLAFVCPSEKSIQFTDPDYSKHTYKTFARLGAANRSIDLGDIDYDLLNASVFYATNRQRVLNKRKEFVFLDVMRDAATLHAKQMVQLNFFNHLNDKNPKLKTPLDRIYSVGGSKKHGWCSENIAETFLLNYEAGASFRVEKTKQGERYFDAETNQEIVPHTYLSFGEALLAQWMNSPGHRTNILNADYTHLGCGGLQSLSKYAGNFPKIKYTQVFCKLQ